MDDTLEKVVGCLREVFESMHQTPPHLGSDTKLDASLGLRSLDYAELVVRLEEEFGTDPFATGIPPGIDTVADLAALYSPR